MDQQLPIFFKDSQGTRYRIILDETDDGLPIISLQKFLPKHWNQGIEDAPDDDFVQIAYTESIHDDITDLIEDYLGEIEML